MAKNLADHFAYLDRLRESGRTNMWGAPPFLVRAHGLSDDEAKDIHLLWMDTFDPDFTAQERAAKVEADRNLR